MCCAARRGVARCTRAGQKLETVSGGLPQFRQVFPSIFLETTFRCTRTCISMAEPFHSRFLLPVPRAFFSFRCALRRLPPPPRFRSLVRRRRKTQQRHLRHFRRFFWPRSADSIFLKRITVFIVRLRPGAPRRTEYFNSIRYACINIRRSLALAGSDRSG